MNVYRNIDRSKVQFDFLVHYKEEKFYSYLLKNKNYKIIYTEKKNNYSIFERK